MKRVLAMLAVAVGAGLAGCDRGDQPTAYDGTIDGVAKRTPPAVDLTILDNQKRIAEERARAAGGGSSGGSTATPTATTAAPSTKAAPATGEAPATGATTTPATQGSTGGGDSVPPPPPSE